MRCYSKLSPKRVWVQKLLRNYKGLGYRRIDAVLFVRGRNATASLSLLALHPIFQALGIKRDNLIYRL